MKKYFLVIIVTGLLSSCGESSEKQETQKKESETRNPKLQIFNMQGYWANIGFMGKAKQKGLGNFDFYCTEMTFDADSVLIDNGFESYKLKYSLSDSVCTLLNATQGKNLELRIETADFIQFKDSSLKNIHGNDFFNRIPANGLKFNTMLNENLLVGSYFVYENNKKTIHEVKLERNGEIKGLTEYKSYRICYSGDCTSSPLKPANIITIRNKNVEEDDYVWKKDYATNNLKIFKLEAAKPDMKGGRKIEKQILDLRP